jgi:hypothetical protein
VPKAAPATPAPPSTTPAIAAPPPEPTGPPSNGHRPTLAGKHRSDPVTGLLVGASLTAAGAVIALDRFRRVQQRRRLPGQTIPTPTGKAADAELALRRRAADAPTERLDTALRALAATLSARPQRTFPAIDAATVGRDVVEILLSAPVSAAPGPFRVEAQGRAWSLDGIDLDPDITTLAATRGAPAPALTVIGTVDDRQVLIDLEHPGHTNITGDADSARAVWSAVALNLATNTWADDLHIVIVGEPPAGIQAIDRVDVVDSTDDIIDRLEGEILALTTALHDAGCATTIDARIRAIGDGWTPTIVLLDGGNEAVGVRQLADLAVRHGGLAVVSLDAESDASDREIAVRDGRLRITPPGIEVDAVGLTPDDLPAIAQLVEIAVAEPTPAEDVSEPAEPEETVNGMLPLVAPDELPDGVVVHHVMGTFGIDGGTEINRPRSREFAAYLALHPDGVDEGRLKAALWRERAPTTGSFNQTVSAARSALGAGPDGQLHIPHVSGRLYRAGPYMITDFAMLKAAYRWAAAKLSDSAAAVLAAWLGYVRGLPLEGTPGFEWAHSEGIVTEITQVVSDAAHLVATWALEHGDPDGALAAAERGCRGAPGNEILYRDRMLAHEMAGNTAAVKAVMDELCHVIETVEPYDGIHSETLALYERLTRPTKQGITRPAAHPGSRVG